MAHRNRAFTIVQKDLDFDETARFIKIDSILNNIERHFQPAPINS